jgi:hypothetical protein
VHEIFKDNPSTKANLMLINRIIFSAIISFFVFSVVGCSKGGSSDNKPVKDTIATNPPATYFITFKANGVAVTETEISASRGTTGGKRTLTITGTTKNGAVPKFKFYTEESFIGFVEGLNVGSSNISYPNHYTDYTDASNTLYSTKNSTDGVLLFISGVSYTKDGVVKGTFSGDVKTDKGATVQITEGKYNVQFSN